MSEQSKPATEAEVLGEERDKAALPAEVRDVFNRLYRLLKDAPWVGFGAGLAAMGAAILYFYFQSIDYLPADIPAILAASAAVAALALAFMLMMALSLIAPRWGFQNVGLSGRLCSADHRDSLWGIDWLLLAFQLIGPGAVFLHAAYRSYAACTAGWGYLAVPGAVIFLVGVGAWLSEERKMRGAFFGLPERNWKSLLVPLWSTLPFLALFSFLIPSQGVEWADLVMLLAVWLGMVYLNAKFHRELPLWVLAFLALVLLPALLLSAPTFVGRPSAFPIKVAELAGIRDRKPSELRIPTSTCSLIQSGLTVGQTSADLRCDSAGEWGSVKAQVLSNLGNRWWIEVPVDAGDKAGGGGSLRITIPGEGVQTVRRIVPKEESAASCSPWPWGKSQTSSAL